MSAEQNQELIDLLLGELDPEREAELVAMVRRDPAMQRELQHLETLFGLMRGGEEIDVDAGVHASIMREAQRLSRPSLAARVASIPGLFRFRFQRSILFRVAAISLAVHLVAVAVLWQFHVVGGGIPAQPGVREMDPSDVADLPVPDYQPDRDFVVRLGRARVSRSVRLNRYGVPGQRDAIREGVETLLAKQLPDGSFGSTDQTGRAALVLLGEGVNSTDASARGKAVRNAIGSLLIGIDAGNRDGFALSALIEDWVFSYDRLTEEERMRYVRAIRTLIPTVRGAGADEALVLAELAGLPVASDQLSGGLATILDRSGTAQSARDIVSRPASRLSATAVIARIQEDGEQSVGIDREALRRWLDPAFRGALTAGRGGDTDALLLLQAPYRL